MAKDKDILTKAVEAPAEMIEMSIETAEEMASAISNAKPVRLGRDYWHTLGPGLTTGAADDDPSGIATYSQTGAQFGFGLLWLAAFTFPLMAIVQEMCARIGLVTGRGLAGNIRLHFPRWVIYLCTTLLFAANTFNLGADLGAMAKGVQLLRPGWDFAAIVIGFTLLCLFLQIFMPYARYAKYLKWLAMVLLAYVASALVAHLNWGDVLHHAFVPHIRFEKSQLLLITAILGTTISPYLFFWQTSQEVEEQILLGNTTVASRQTTKLPSEMQTMRRDVWSGMFLSNVVMFFIIAACGGILFPHGITNITSAAQAAEALRPFAGNATYALFAAGIIGTGLLAIPVLAGSSSYALAESFKWREGLYRSLRQAYAFYGVLIISMAVGLFLNFVGLDPIKALIYSAVANGIVAPIVLVLIVILASNRKLMGEWVNRPHIKWLGWLITTIMVVAGSAAIYSLF